MENAININKLMPDLGDRERKFVIHSATHPQDSASEAARVAGQEGHLLLLLPCRRGVPKIFGLIYAILVHWLLPNLHTHREIQQNFNFRELIAMLEATDWHVKSAKSGSFAVTNLLVRRYRRLTRVHLLLSRMVEALHLGFLTVNTEFHCILADKR